jgi:hypothetical protein
MSSLILLHLLKWYHLSQLSHSIPFLTTLLHLPHLLS